MKKIFAMMTALCFSSAAFAQNDPTRLINPEKDYSGVVEQQGRVQPESDQKTSGPSRLKRLCAQCLRKNPSTRCVSSCKTRHR